MNMKSSLFILLFSFSLLWAGTKGNLVGYVFDSQTMEPLPGANVYLKGTSIGTPTTIKGKFEIFDIPAGDYTLVVNYVGYKEKELPIKIEANKTLKLVIKLDYISLTGEVIEVTAQAEGQIAAINQQLSARTIKNVVSSARIQEIPDANAAESVGRLPGVALLRDGGEGNKVIIRGLSPKYNKITIEGVNLAATGSDDRSTNLSMISPYMLEGIELTKALLPNQEADALGGQVNFLIKDAKEGLHLNALAQGGYNGLHAAYGDYKFVFGVSNRFFNNKLGAFAQIDLERRNRSSYEMNTTYTIYDYSQMDVSIKNMALNDISRINKRYGATLVLDYQIPNGKIKLSNFLSRINRDVEKRNEQYDPDNLDHYYTLVDYSTDLTVMTNALRFEKRFWGMGLNSAISYSFSENKLPKVLSLRGMENSAFFATLDQTVHPTELIRYAKNDTNKLYLKSIDRSSSYTRESELAVEMNVTRKFNFTSWFELNLEIGTKLKRKVRRFDKEAETVPIDWGGRQQERDAILMAFPWMQEVAPLGTKLLPYKLFIDRSYQPHNFLNHEYIIRNMPDLSLMRKTDKVLDKMYFYNYPVSLQDDYHGEENYKAFYVMPEVKLSNIITFIPGLRYEKNRTTYHGVRGSSVALKWNEGYQHHDTSTTRINTFWLPMLHLKIKPLSWFDIRLAYTQTLARPNYNHIVPKWDIQLNSVSWNNPFLKPAKSENYDVYLSFYGNAIGLFTVGGFYKEITDLIFYSGRRVILDPAEYGLPESEVSKVISSQMNNPNPVTVKGFELEWQTHFWYLPKPLNGLVLNANFTRSFSDAKYPKVEIVTKYLTQPPWVIQTNVDTFYTNRLINQPDDIINLTLGYDYKDFSIRVSMLYQSDIFKRSNFYRELRATTEAYTRWDLSIRQKLPVEGLELLLNWNNITDEWEQNTNLGTGYPEKIQQYGMTADIALRYKF